MQGSVFSVARYHQLYPLRGEIPLFLPHQFARQTQHLPTQFTPSHITYLKLPASACRAGGGKTSGKDSSRNIIVIGCAIRIIGLKNIAGTVQ